MKKICTVVGVFVGVVTGIVSLFRPVEVLPALLTNTTLSVASALLRILMPNDDPMGAFLIEIPVLVLIIAIMGGVVGLLAGWLWDRMRQKRWIGGPE